MKKIIAVLSLFSLVLNLNAQKVASGEQDTQETKTSSHTLNDFQNLKKGLLKEDIEQQLGKPDEYQRNGYTQYVYYVEDNQVVVLQFSEIGSRLIQASVWPKNHEEWPSSGLFKPYNGKPIPLTEEVKPSAAPAQAPSAEDNADAQGM